MPDDAPRHLESLTVSRLKAVADHYAVDVSSCKHKKDLVTRLAEAGITEAQVSEVLKGEGSTEAGASDEQALRREVEAIAEKGPGQKVLPSDEDEDAEKNIDRVLLSRPSFFEIDSAMESAWNHMIMADYRDALKVNSEARSRMLDRFSSFQIFSAALSIRAAESIINSIRQAKGRTDPALMTALAEAKKAFIEGVPRRREETLGELERLTSKAYEAFFEGSAKAEEDLRAMLLEYESFGSQTQEPRRLLQIAEQARQAFNVAEYARLLRQAQEAAGRAKSTRAAEINRSFNIVRSAVREARDVGAVLTVGEKDLEAAKQAIDTQAFKRALELLASIERVADQAHSEKMKDKATRDRQAARVSNTIAGLEGALQEARSYGMDVDEGLLFVSHAKMALAQKDLVTAAKLTRKVKDDSSGIHDELDKKRVEHGVAKKIEDAKCGKCGEVSLYSFPGEVRKCVKCGHSFSMTSTPRPSTMESIEAPVSTSGDAGGPAAAPNQDGAAKKKPLIRTLKK